MFARESCAAKSAAAPQVDKKGETHACRTQRPVALNKTRRNGAIVMGGSVAGIAASRLLSDHFREVVVVECCAFPRTKEKSNMKVANTVIGSESLAVGLRGRSVLPGDDEVTIIATPQQILRSALAALSEGRISEIVGQFADRFIFSDHALKFEFTDKNALDRVP